MSADGTFGKQKKRISFLRSRMVINELILGSAWPYRKITSHHRTLPSVIIVGAMKSGTSSLFSYLKQHPQLFASNKKEVHFFDSPSNLAKGQSWYRAHFPIQKRMGFNAKAFEASPRYLFDPFAPEHIFSLLPRVKIIAVLRNPTDRAISHYFHERRRNREPLPIHDALQQEESRLARSIKAKDYWSKEYIHYSYKKRGLYKEQLERYLHFFPRRQILTVPSEGLFSAPDHHLTRIFEFLGVDTEFKINNLRPHNTADERPDIAPVIYEHLRSYFAPHNQELYKLIGESYSW